MSGRTAGARRIRTVLAGLGVLTAGVVWRAIDLSIVRASAYQQRAQRQHRQIVRLVPQRGDIVDRNGRLLAESVDVPSLVLDAKVFNDHARLPEVARLLGMPVERVERLAAKSRHGLWLKRQARYAEHDAVMALGLKGIRAVMEPRRFYPHGSLAAHVLGHVDIDARGGAGVEQWFDSLIRGTPETFVFERDGLGRPFTRDGVVGPPRSGSRVELTIDARIQGAAERALAAGVERARAAGGTAVVLDPRTGEVLALANVPSFDPNDRSSLVASRTTNRAVTSPFEPGSTFKIFAAAAALEERLVRPDELVFCENGAWQVGKWTINDAHPHGTLSFAEVIQFSSNIGIAKIAERLGRERFGSYLRRFGFGERTGIELPGESPGIVRDPSTWTRVDLVVQSFGQGIAVTPLQMAAAYAAIANGGDLVRPHLVRRIVSPSGEVQREAVHRPLRRVVSPRTAEIATALLRRVVDERGGTGGRARLETYPVAGKTGTAQKVVPGGRGYSSKRIGSFIGFVPADAPRAVIYVVIDEPSGITYGGVVAAPVFREIAAATMHTLGVAPRVPAGPEPSPGVVLAAAGGRSPARTRTAGATARAGRAVGGEAAVASVPPLPGPEPADATPSFLGLSLREALTRAHAGGWAVEIEGQGWVAGQEPPPGAPPRPDRRLALQLTAWPGGARP